MSGAAGTPDVGALLPHGERARFVDAVLELAADSIACLARVPEDRAYVAAGSFPSFVALELAAQSAALLELLGRPAGDASASRRGYLVRARDVRCEVPRIPAGRPLVCRVRRTGSAGRLRVFDTEISLDGEVVVRGAFSVYLDEPATTATDS